MDRRWRAAIIVGLLAVVGGSLWVRRARAPAKHHGSVEGRVAVLPDRPAPAGSTEQIVGETRNDNGQPIAGATVLVNTSPTTIVTSDRRGRFSLSGLPPQKYTLVARADDSVSDRAVADAARVDLKPVVLTLHRGASIVATVLDASDGNPIADASVVVRGFANISERTDARGRVDIGGLEMEKSVVRVSARGYATVWSTVDLVAPRRDSLVFRLVKGLSVSGRLLSPVNVGLGGAAITMERALSFYDLSNQDDAVKSDENGQWIIEGIAPGRYRFRATHPAFPDAVSAPVEVRAAAVSGLEIHVAAATSLSGRVLDRDGRGPPSGTVVAWYQVGRYLTGEIRTAKVERDGAFVLTGLHRGSLALQASTPVGQSSPLDVDVGAAASSGVQLTIDADLGLKGRLLFPDNRAATEVPVEVSVLAALDGDPLSSRLRKRDFSRTDQAGRFRATGLVPGLYSVSARLQDSGVTWRAREIIRGDDGGRERKIPLLPSAEVVGRALTASGSPVLSLGATVDDDPVPVVVRSGDFAIKGLAAGHHELVLSVAGFAPVLIERMNLRAGDTMDVGEIRFMPARTVCGRVVSAGDGRPVQGARIVGGVMLVGDGAESLVPEAARLGSTIQAISDPQGRFCLRRASNGTLTVSAQAPDGRTGSTSAVAGPRAPDVVVPVDLPGAIHGIVSSPNADVAGLDVVVVRETVEGQRRMVKLGPDGQFQFERLPAGTYAVAVMLERATTYQMHARRVVVSPGAAAKLELELELGDSSLRIATACQGIEEWPSQVYVVSGEVSARTVGDLDLEVWSGRHPVFGIAFAYLAAPASLPSVPPGAYSVCAARPAPASEMVTSGTAAGARPVSCVPVTVSRRGVQSVGVPCS